MYKENSNRTVIGSVYPKIDQGDPSIEQEIDEKIIFNANLFKASHDETTVIILYLREKGDKFSEITVSPAEIDERKEI